MDDVTRRKRSFAAGYLLSLAGIPLPLRPKVPIAYLYNGVRLPKLPEWDNPYATILKPKSTGIGKYWLLVSTAPACVKDETELYGTEYCDMKRYVWNEGDAEWTYNATGVLWSPTDNMGYFSGTVIWANYDVADYNDGSVFCAASKPIPVYE